ncbi:MAG: hypothetical protein U0166_02575 [Acidobacteriota bacterium]
MTRLRRSTIRGAEKRARLPLVARGVVLSLGLVTATNLQAAPATDAYLKFRAAVAKASAPPDVAPFLVEIRRDMLGVATADEARVWFEDFKEAHAQLDVVVTSEKTTDKGVHLSASGKRTKDGAPTKGSIDMVAEGGDWKVFDELWYVEWVPGTSKDAEKDFAKGTFTVNGKPAAMKHVTATPIPYAFDESAPAVRLVFSDVPVGDESAASDRVKGGELHYFELEVGPKQNVTTGMMHHEGYGPSTTMSMAGMHRFDAKTFGPTIIEGRAWIGTEPSGEDRTAYDVEFRVTVRTAK